MDGLAALRGPRQRHGPVEGSDAIRGSQWPSSSSVEHEQAILLKHASWESQLSRAGREKWTSWASTARRWSVGCELVRVWKIELCCLGAMMDAVVVTKVPQ
jgi:hypothetical protein